MTTIRANWHLGDLDLPDEPAAAHILALQSMPTLDLRSSDDIIAAFQATVLKEEGFASVLYQECDLKWSVLSADGSARNPCRTCPMFCTDKDDPDSLLCTLGREQEDLLDAYVAAKAMEGLDGEMLAVVERRFDAAAELAEALL